MEPQSPDMYDDMGEDTWEQVDKQEPCSESTSPSGPNAATQSQGKPSMPTQKRRRVTRACDECRRKKIKCDGKQPCTHCTVYSYDCTYDQPSNRRRNPAPQYIESLEGRVHRAESLLHMIIPNLDLNDPAIDVAVAQGFIPGLKSNKMPDVVEARAAQQRTNAPGPMDGGKDTNLESMVRAVGQIELDENGNWDYHGHSSGLSFVRRMREQLGDLMGPDTQATPFVKTRPRAHIVDSPKSANNYESPMGTDSSQMDLPSEEVARELCNNSVMEAAALLRPIHLPTFWRSFKRIYTMSPDQYVDEDQRFLPLLYSCLALGTMFGKDDEMETYESAIDQGFKYFRSARQMMDIADCRDLVSIQAVLFMIMFLQSSARLSQCYAYVGVALRSALRMGLHRSIAGGFNPVEAEVRKRVFWAIRKMDIYVGAMLGLPQTLSDEDIDQDFPIEVDDEYITEAGILPMPEGTVSNLVAFNAHTRLTVLLTKIVRNVYPIRIKNGGANAEKTYTVPFSVIRDIENDLENWKSSLPEGLTPTYDNSKLTRAQQLLRLAYAFAQVLLYRPFLHFVGRDKRGSHIDQRAYTCAASYVNVARNIIHLCVQMKQKRLLNGAFWFIMYTTFFAILSLVYFAAENPDNPTSEALMKDALEGRAIIKSLAKRSMAADRCTATLDLVFSHLPEYLREGRMQPTMSKKRRQDSSRSPLNGLPQAARSHPDVIAAVRDQQAPQPPQRASTFPKHQNPTSRVETSGFESSVPSGAPSVSGLSSAGPYTPTNANFAPQAYGQMDTSPESLQQQYGLQPNLASIPDLSAMMFPSAEPFTYPNQPLTTFENSRSAKEPSFYNGITGYDSSASMMPQSMQPTSDSDNLEAQLFTLPPQLSQAGQWNGMGMSGQNRQAQMGGMSSATNQASIGATSLPAWNGYQQMPQGQTFSDINLNDIFGGGEWNNMFADFQ